MFSMGWVVMACEIAGADGQGKDNPRIDAVSSMPRRFGPPCFRFRSQAMVPASVSSIGALKGNDHLGDFGVSAPADVIDPLFESFKINSLFLRIIRQLETPLSDIELRLKSIWRS